MMVYIATSLDNRAVAESFRVQLEAAGIQVTSSWSKDSGNTRERERITTTEQWVELAEANYDAIDKARHVVFIHHPTTKGGAIAEVAFAKGRGYPVLCVGNERDSTLMLANYPWVRDPDTAHKWCLKMAGV